MQCCKKKRKILIRFIRLNLMCHSKHCNSIQWRIQEFFQDLNYFILAITPLGTKGFLVLGRGCGPPIAPLYTTLTPFYEKYILHFRQRLSLHKLGPYLVGLELLLLLRDTVVNSIEQIHHTNNILGLETLYM